MNKNNNHFLLSFLSAAGTFIYVSAISWLLFNGETIFARTPTFFIPVFMLLLFIVSAVITGSLVLAKPISLYISGSRKEAFISLFTTLGWLIVFLVVVAIVLSLG